MNIQWILAYRYLSGRKLRTTLTTLAVIFGVMVIFGMNTLIPTVMQAFEANALKGGGYVDLTVSPRSGDAFASTVLDDVRGVDGVRVAQGILYRQMTLPADFFDHNAAVPDAVSSLSLVGMDPEAALQMKNYPVAQGHFLEAADRGACVITHALADSLGLKVGDTLPLPGARGEVRLTVIGIRPEAEVAGQNEILITLPEAQQLLDAAGKINVVEANYNTGDTVRQAEIRKTVEAKLGDGFRYGSFGSETSTLYASLQVGQVVLNLIGFLALFMGAFIIFNTFRTLVAERRHDIGMLRAVGASRRMVIGLILAESLLQGAFGTLVGMLLGYLFGAVALKGLGSVVENFTHVKVGVPAISPALMIGSLVLGIGITVLSGLLPALSAGKVTPLEALRPTQAAAEQRSRLGRGTLIGAGLVALAVLALLSGITGLLSLGALLLLIGLVAVAPALIRPFARVFGGLFTRMGGRDGSGFLAQGNLVRQPGRAAITISTTMIALAILVGMGGAINALKNAAVEAESASLGSDYLFIPPSVTVWNSNVGADASFAQSLKAVDGVGPVSTFRAATTEDTQGSEISLIGVDPQAFPQVAGLRFAEGKPDQAFPALTDGRTMIVNGVFAANEKVKTGDVLPIITPKGPQDYRVVAVASDFLNFKIPTAYISQANLAADFGVSTDIFVQLNLRPGADKAAVEPQLKAIAARYPQFAMVSGPAYLAQTVQMIDAVMAGMYLLFIFLLVPSLIAMVNTLAISVIERTREIGMLRAVGSTQKQVRRMILIEALLLAAAGTAFGLLSGLYLSYALVAAFRTTGFPMQYAFPIAGVLVAVVAGLAFGALSAVIPARQAARLEIIQALRYE